MTEPEKQAKDSKIELPDVMLIFGLAFVFTGLGFAVSWAIALVVTGVILISLAVWLLTPSQTKGSKA